MGEKDIAAILEMAIKKEEEAYEFYSSLLDVVKEGEAKETLQFLASDELKHKTFLEDYRKGGLGPEALRLSAVVDYRIAEHLEKPDAAGSMKSKDVYLIAAHRELHSYNFYTSLANVHPEGKAREVLLRMANEEAKHKEKMEYLYSNTAFPQTDGG